MQRVAEITCRQVAFVHVLSVAFVYYNAVGYFHNAALNALKLVAGACKLDQQEEVNHRVACRLALSYAYRLDEYLVVTRCLTQYYRLARLACHTAQRACRRTGTDEGILAHGQLLHSCLVAQYAAFRAFRAWVYCQHGKLPASTVEHMQAELVYRRTLSRARHAADANAQ